MYIEIELTIIQDYVRAMRLWVSLFSFCLCFYFLAFLRQIEFTFVIRKN